MTIPEDVPTRYSAVLFYRGQWWPYCNRQLAEWEALKGRLQELGCTIYAMSCDTLEQAKGMVISGITFPIGYDCSKDDGEAVGAGWGNHPPYGKYIQPTEFLLRGNVILGSMYASGPVGRMSAHEAIALIVNRERRRS